MSNLFRNILVFLAQLFIGKSKARILLDRLKADPKNKDLAQEVKDLFTSHPIDLIDEVLRRAKEPRQEDVGNEQVDSSTERQTWKNTIKKEMVEPLEYLRPKSKQDLIDLVKKAEAQNLLVRAVGKGHSFSDVANASDILVDMLELNASLPLESETLKTGLPDLFNVQSGMLVEKINAELDQLGLAIPTMAAFDQETIYGAAATSTHGTGLNIQGMSNMIKSMDIVATDGICYRLEPTNGISDPQKFEQKYPNNEIILIQEDQKFHSSVVSFGLMGIVYSVVISPVKTFYLLQRLWVTNWATVRPKLADRSLFKAINHNWDPIGNIPGTDEPKHTRAQVFVNPYVTKNFMTKTEGHTCVVQVQTEISKAELDKLNEQLKDQPKSNLINFISEIEKNGMGEVHRQVVSAEDKNSIVEELATDALLMLLNDFPLLTPLFLDISMIVLLSGSGKFGKSFQVMNQGKLAIKNAGYSMEPGFPVDTDNTFIGGVEEIFNVVKLSEGFDTFLTAPFTLRFVQASNDYLSPEYNTDTCMIDLALMLGTEGDDQMLDRLQLDLLPHGAKPHWGKICNMVNGEELLKKMYPKFDTFRETVQFFNPKGTFNSSFSYRTGMTKMIYDKE